MVVDFLASRGPGVSYGLAIADSPDNYVSSYASGYPGQDVTPYSMLLPFTYAGVTGAYMYKPPDAARGRASSARTRRTSSSAAATSRSIYDAILEQRGTPTGTFGGRVVDELTQRRRSRART